MKRILFAHPDQKFSEIYVQHLKPHFLVDSAHDGLLALRKFKLSAPSMVISDYDLPLLSGLSLLKFVRSHPTFHSIPFVFLTRHHDNSQALNFGANDWIDSSMSHPDYLLDKIYHHLKYVQIH